MKKLPFLIQKLIILMYFLDDCLGFVYTITVKFFENKVVKTIIVITLIFQIIVSLINTFFFIKYFDFKFFNQFISNYLAFMRVSINFLWF
jgi:hypothetical protein